jgi:hypothetical protein
MINDGCCYYSTIIHIFYFLSSFLTESVLLLVDIVIIREHVENKLIEVQIIGTWHPFPNRLGTTRHFLN